MFNFGNAEFIEVFQLIITFSSLFGIILLLFFSKDKPISKNLYLKNQKLPTCVSKGYLLSQAKGITRIFTDYIETKDKPTFDNIGNTTIIPNSVVKEIKKLS